MCEKYKHIEFIQKLKRILDILETIEINGKQNPLLFYMVNVKGKHSINLVSAEYLWITGLP